MLSHHILIKPHKILPNAEGAYRVLYQDYHNWPFLVEAANQEQAMFIPRFRATCLILFVLDSKGPKEWVNRAES